MCLQRHFDELDSAVSEGCGPGRKDCKYVQLLEVILIAVGHTVQAPVHVWSVLTWLLQLKLPTVVLYTHSQWNIADNQGP